MVNRLWRCQGKQHQQTVFYLAPCTRSQCSEGEVFELSAEGKNQIEEGRQDCWNAGERTVAHSHIFLTVYCKHD